MKMLMWNLNVRMWVNIQVHEHFFDIMLPCTFNRFLNTFLRISEKSTRHRFINTFSQMLTWNLNVRMWVTIQVHEHFFDIMLPCTFKIDVHFV
jgi:hypothetical protein